MSFWCHHLDQNTNKKIDKFLPQHLKSGQVKKIKALYYIKQPITNIRKCLYFFDLTTLQVLGQKFVKFFRWKKNILKLSDLQQESFLSNDLESRNVKPRPFKFLPAFQRTYRRNLVRQKFQPSHFSKPMKSQYSISTNQKTAVRSKLAERSVEGQNFPCTSQRA